MALAAPPDKPDRTIIGTIWQAESTAATAGLYLRMGDRRAAIEARQRAEDAARAARIRLIANAPSALDEAALEGDR